MIIVSLLSMGALLSPAASFGVDLMPGTTESSQPGSDAWITTKAKLALFAEDNVPATSIHVTTIAGTVHLTGKVESEQSKMKAEQAIKKIDGVKAVKNDLQIVPDAKRKVVERSDDQIEERIKQVFELDRALDKADLEADANNGVVSLKGKVDDPALVFEAAAKIYGLEGVKSVKTDMVEIERRGGG
jgi:osmotically-inducible protein OsmY